MRTIVIATNNKNKVKEFAKIFSSGDGCDYEVLSLADVGFVGDIVEDADTFEGNAYIKARTVSDHTGLVAIADDSGLEVDALNGAPGVYSARYAGEGADSAALIAKLLGEMSSVPDGERGARFVSVMCAAFPNGKKHFAKGVCEGEILTESAGDNGFGYDPVFYYKPFDKSYAEMSSEEKNSISHRALATVKLLEDLRSFNDEDFPSHNS